MSDGNGNPKDFVGANKAPLGTMSRRVLHEIGLGMLEGECKYWRHNYRAADVRAMVYVDAMERHISAWVEGQDVDPASGLSHIVKAMCCLLIIRDAQLYGSLIDDRPPAQADPNWIDELNAKALAIVESTKGVTRGAYTEANREQWPAFSAALSRGPIKREAEAHNGQHKACPACITNLCARGCGKNLGPYEECKCEALGPVRTRLGETNPPIDAFVPYVPKCGEEVSIEAIAPFDVCPTVVTGQVAKVHFASVCSVNIEEEERSTWIFLKVERDDAGTWCRVKPV